MITVEPSGWKRLKRVLIGALVTLVVVIGGCVVLITATMPSTRFKVTVVNRTDQPLLDGTYGYESGLHAAQPPLDMVPVGASVTGDLGANWTDSPSIHYRVMGVDDTVYVGYPSDVGGVEQWWIVAEGDSLSVDSSYLAPKRGYGAPRSWSRRQNALRP